MKINKQFGHYEATIRLIERQFKLAEGKAGLLMMRLRRTRYLPKSRDIIEQSDEAI